HGNMAYEQSASRELHENWRFQIYSSFLNDRSSFIIAHPGVLGILMRPASNNSFNNHGHHDYKTLRSASAVVDTNFVTLATLRDVKKLGLFCRTGCFLKSLDIVPLLHSIGSDVFELSSSTGMATLCVRITPPSSPATEIGDVDLDCYCASCCYGWLGVTRTRQHAVVVTPGRFGVEDLQILLLDPPVDALYLDIHFCQSIINIWLWQRRRVMTDFKYFDVQGSRFHHYEELSSITVDIY
ncbi:hypothetical protein HAX54_050009, partial [Datura stramonium]|nr:hypothetical protein [Datura stramonium]